MAHAARRALLLFASGVVIDYLHIPSRTFPFIGFEAHIQLSGALQKISICYLLAFLIYLWIGLRGVIVGIVGLNLLYLGFLYFFPVPGCGPGSLSISCNFPGYIDKIVLDGFRWDLAAFDPDGVGAILPATTSVLFGVLAGRLLVQDDQQPRQRLLWLLSAGLALIAAGELLSEWVPLNKQLWTTSFAVLMAGLAATGLAFAIWLVDGRHAMPHFLRPLEILGLNAIAAYLISRLVVNVPKVHVHGKSLHDDFLAPFTSPATASLLFAMIVLAAVFLVIWFMDRQGWHLRL
jgi:predicted acyltransferase